MLRSKHLTSSPGPSLSNTLSFDLSSLEDLSTTSFFFEELIALNLYKHAHNAESVQQTY